MLAARMSGRRRTRAKFKELAQNAGLAIDDFIDAMALKVISYSRDMMEEPKSGRFYSYPSGIHQASAPGEAPAIVSTLLWNSFEIDDIRINQYAAGRIVSNTAPYAVDLELFGPDRNGQPRPFLQPAFDRAATEIGQDLFDSWRKFS